MNLEKEDFELIRNTIRERCGIWLSDAKVSFLKARLSGRLKETSMETARDYYYFLKYDPEGEREMDHLIDAVAVNETYFFREEAQLGAFSEMILPEIGSAGRAASPVTIWSAACSTGEEPYTLAILLLESPLKTIPARVRILASDISQTALRAAREGVYDDYSVRHVPAALMEKYFDKIGDGRYAVKDRVKQMVSFARINLMDSAATARVKNMECIFCRNVLIYFDDPAKARCITHLYQSINAGGYLLLGHSESLARISDLFNAVRMDHCVLYRRQQTSRSG